MKYKIIFLVIILFGLGSYYLVRAGYYPLVLVNSTVILANEFRNNYNAAAVYYQNVFNTYSPENLKKINIPEFLDELRRATLDKMVENVLIYSELNREIGNDLPILVERKIPKFEEITASLYGLTAVQFKELVLKPQARREILEGRLFLNKLSVDDWMLHTRSEAKVLIFSSSFTWIGGKVVHD